ncbi:MAG: CapA family protein [Gammaproteobacteria bacterium]|nr:CapA family protein [Gammaproteobacteria bacterium]
MMKRILILLLCLPCIALAKVQLIKFPDRCTPGHNIVVAAVGDILLHQPLQMRAAKVGFADLWRAATFYVQGADIAFANLEGPVAEGVSKHGKVVKDPGHRWDNHVYSSFPLFNYHPNLVRDLKASGFDIVNLANNHSLDRYSIGLDRSIKLLNSVGLKYTGARLANGSGSWVTILKHQNFRIAFIGCAVHTNGIKDKHHQILRCYAKHDRQTLLNLIYKLRNQVDAIIITPHWGKQYSQVANANQRRFAKQVLNAGAMAVIGTHPHCLQPMQKYRTKDGRETFIAYSLGNFVSYQGTPKNRASVILYLSFTKTPKGTVISGMRYLPIYMQNRSGHQHIKLTMLSPKNKNSVGYKIITRVLPKGNLMWPNFSLQRVGCLSLQPSSL